MINLFAIAAAVSALLAIAGEGGARRHRAFYVLKPLTTLCILGMALTARDPVSPHYQQLIAGALVLSTLGDISLMFEGDRWFIGGLSSFLLAHLLFVGAFVQGLPAFAVPWPAWLVIPYGAVLLTYLLPRAGSLKIPVLIYCAAIFAMVICAAARHAALEDARATFALIGASLFVLSDSSLAIRQFRGPYPGAQPLILSTYWLAIGFIAASV
ncbi:MAG TPA: lysoplasmalogenase [Nevskiaceae bacterium]|nr:lysoplasmalogenase [Nevskiaceae bacterium]